MTTKEKIIKAAIALMAKNGFAETSFQALADKVGLTQTAVLYHFENKDKLLEAVIQTIAVNNHRIVSELMNVEDGARERLEKHFQGNLDWAHQYPEEACVLVLLYYMACFNERFKKIYNELLPRARFRVEEHLQAGLREGVFHFSEKPDELSLTMHDLLLGGFINTVTVANDQKTLTDLKKRWNTTFEKLLGIRKVRKTSRTL